ncbi:MAG: hypothetical protein ACJ704_10690 [Nitrososphaeraceae archaeon]
MPAELKSRVSFICYFIFRTTKYFVVDDDDMIIPKSVRHLIDDEEMYLGQKKGANRQLHFRNLHIREYDEYYTVHSDKINPRNDPFGQPPVDTPDYLATVLSVVFIGTQVSSTINKGKNE